jgi:N-acetylglucosaminyldiphosphoundecaprenol N-acetyl-beta-D-mannosaminyltransferase
MERFEILGVPVSVVNLQSATNEILSLASMTKPSMVFVREVASLMAAFDEPRLKGLHDKAALVVPDGMPLVWLGRARGLGRKLGRVSGADLIDAISQKSLITGQSHFFYGGKPGVAERMAQNLQAKYPGLKVAGVFSPPMRDIGREFAVDADVLNEISQIAQHEPDFIWVGLSSPKQEYWMSAAIEALPRGVCLGVGAAFDFHSGAVKRAPRWMQASGLEWFHRLASEPRRLWRRYLILAPRFLIGIVLGEWLIAKKKSQ